MLATQELSAYVLLKSILVQVADGKIGIYIHDDTVLVHLLNLSEVDDIGTVYAHEVLGQAFLYLLH